LTVHGKTIRIYLADGTPSGIRYAELVNWTGQAVVCPRARIGELAKWDEAQRPGIYFLVGDDDSESRQVAYIGEAENVFARLQSHVKNKEFWTRVVFFTSKDDNVTKAHVKYLEARLVEIANEAARARIENGNAPNLPALPRSDRDAMEEFLGPIRTLLGTLGFPLLQSVSPNAGSGIGPEQPTGISGKRLTFATGKRNINADGAVTDEGFVVYQGSVGDAEVRHHLRKALRAHREQLIANGAIEEQAETIRFAKDVLFTSPSAAAAVLAGGAYNGREAWKDEQGTTLKALEEALAGQSSEERS
jgi:hypothetical protein